MKKIFSFLILFLSTLFFSQNQLEKIELRYSNSIIIGSTIKITIEPVKIGKKRMMLIVESKKKHLTKKLSKKEYANIEDAILRINPKNLYDIPDNGKDIIKTTCLDGFTTSITTFKNDKKGTVSIDCLSKMDKYKIIERIFGMPQN
jgi:hypothetical protein